jgi:transposase
MQFHFTEVAFQKRIFDRQAQLITRLKNINQKQKDTIKDLKSELAVKEKQIAKLEEQLRDKEKQRQEMLARWYKPNKKTENDEPRKTRERTYHRPNPSDSEVNEEHSFPICNCPICKKPLSNIADTAIKYEEDIDLAPRKTVKKFIIHRYWCQNCQTFVRSSKIPEIQRIGPNILGYILYARYRLRLPYNLIKDSLLDLHDFKISEGEISQKLKESQELFGKDYEAICKLIQEAKAVYADETGWRMNGDNWWLWVFVTEKGIRYVIEESRGKGVPQLVLGGKADRTIISDGYAAYGKLPGDKQQCWVHLLRNAKAASFLLYSDLLKIYFDLTQELTKPVNERKLIAEFQTRLEEIIQKKYRDLEANKIQNRCQKHLPFLFTCLKHNGVLPENNTAERAIRKQVVMRKIFGGSRSIDGAKAHEVNTSVIETQLRQNPGQSFFKVMLPLIKQRRSKL